MPNQNEPSPADKKTELVEEKDSGRSSAARPLSEDAPKRLKLYEFALIVLSVAFLLVFCFGVFKVIQGYSLRDEIAGLHAKIDSSETAVKRYRETIETVEAERDAVRMTAAELEEKNAELAKDKHTLQNQNQRLAGERASLKAELERIRAQNETLSNLKKKQETRISELTAQADTIRKVKEDLERERTKLSEHIESLKISTEKAKTLIDKMAAEFDQLEESRSGSN